MSTFVISFLIVLLCFAGMSVGALMGRKPIQGSCGGLSSMCRGCRKPCSHARAVKTKAGKLTDHSH